MLDEVEDGAQVGLGRLNVGCCYGRHGFLLAA
jgi:hypothetical protein